MNISKLKVFYEVSGAAAIVASLIFVGFELRQNTVAVESASIDNLTNLTHEFYMTLATDSELHQIWFDNLRYITSDVDEEMSRAIWLERTSAVRYQTALFQWRRGTLGEDDFEFYRPFMCNMDQSPFWQNYIRGAFSPVFVEYVESC